MHIDNELCRVHELSNGGTYLDIEVPVVTKVVLDTHRVPLFSYNVHNLPAVHDGVSYLS